MEEFLLYGYLYTLVDSTGFSYQTTSPLIITNYLTPGIYTITIQAKNAVGLSNPSNFVELEA